MTECVERDYILEKKAAVKEFEEKKIDLKENLLTDMEEKRKIIETDRHTMELTGDSMEVLKSISMLVDTHILNATYTDINVYYVVLYLTSLFHSR